MRQKSVYWLVTFLCICASVQQTVATINNDLYCVILAGGDGTRLWPLSRAQTPKQLLEVVNEQTLLEQALMRVKPLACQEHIWISTTARYAPLIRQKLASESIGHLQVEPGVRNTGPAILLSCLQIYKQDPDAVIVFLPADPFIPTKDNAKFVEFLQHAYDFAKNNDQIVLLGVKPTFAATGYGYIQPIIADTVPYKIKQFCEKPALEIAQQYVAAGMLWNIGVFCARARVFIEQCKKFAPALYEQVTAYDVGAIAYNAIKADSIDYALLEKSDALAVLPADFAWCDVGNLEIFLSLKKQNQAQKSRLIEIDSSNNLVDVASKCVALVGVHDLCVVQTDSILLITPKSQAENVRAVVAMLKKEDLQDYL